MVTLLGISDGSIIDVGRVVGPAGALARWAQPVLVSPARMAQQFCLDRVLLKQMTD